MGGRIAEDNIQELSKCEIFVFGSNLAGQHHGGAARIAHKKFGAEWGVGVGRTGQTYTIPTMHGGITDIKPYVDDFVEYAKSHPNNRFLLTRIGCGIAGFTDEEMAPLFKELGPLPNVCFPVDWLLIIDDFYKGLYGYGEETPEVPLPKALTEIDLKRLCEEYKYIIGARILGIAKPRIRIRYVIGRDRFGYANFGDFFMNDLGLYVWTHDKEFAESHNQDLVEGIFGDECKGRGYFHRAIFAGVETPYKDSTGNSIYTGDVIHLNADGIGDYTFALGSLGENKDDREARYAFALDNHCILPEECIKMERVGTVFYQLDWGDEITLAERCWSFQGYHSGELSDEDKILMAKYTPNFYQEKWKYHANEILGIEYHWK